ncbi:MAG: porin family protein, partial [Bacteroidetes bacterium]|nr:porin family protein [Bacteroidota bacterium]
PRLGLGTGLTYSQQDLQETYSCAFCNTSPIEPKRLNLRFLEIPVFLQYNFLNSKIKLHAQAGFVGSYLISQPDLFYISFNKMLLKGHIGTGANINIGKKFNFQLTPTYSHSFNSLSKETNFKINSFGIIAGLTYRMKK